jgi:2-polyprenyl-6-methoxyphenol hydroxylase-like FAD-dependent oxidoreductase
MSVIVVGAGPAGAATALLLARHGVAVTLVEREPSFERAFRGEGLMPSGMDALLQLGLGGALAAIPSRLVHSWNIHIDGEEALVIPEPIEELGERATRIVSQPALLEQIVAEARRCPSFRVERAARVHDLIRDPTGRVAGVRLETAAGPAEARADLVIGCDGRGSSVRARAGLMLELEPEAYDILWFSLPASPVLGDRCPMLIMVAAGQHPAICYPSWDGRLRYGLVVPRADARAVRAGDWLATAAGPAPAWLAAHLRAQRAFIDGPIRLTVLVGRCRAWSAPGVLLLGDAAHPMSPAPAQGVNLALRDAIVAANHLVPALRAGGGAAALDAAARAIQAKREPEVARAQALQAREARGQGDARSATWRYALARWLAPRLGRHGWVQRAWLRRQRDLRLGATEVTLRLPGGPGAG